MTRHFPVPTEVFDQHIIVLGKTRSGKSSAMRFLVEHLLDAENPVCIIDPKGDWWGLKASADGKHAGYPVVIFGGEHGDVPLNARSGSAVAELVATGNRSAIIDLGGWMPGDRTQFWIDFASTYFRTHRGRHWLVIDEVHNLCPKGKIMDPNAGKMLHWTNRLASEGLGKGIAILAASQRPQKVHNDFLTSCETLIAMRVIHKADRDALKDWVDACGEPEKGKEVLNTVAQNERGEAWVYSPESKFGPEKIKFPMFSTYDSFKPQRAGDSAKLQGWAEVNLAEVTKKLETVVKEAEANDPAKLKQRIRELEQQIRKIPEHRDAAREKELETLVAALNRHIGNMEDFISDQASAMGNAMGVLQKMCDRQPPDIDSKKLQPIIKKNIPTGSSFLHPKLLFPIKPAEPLKMNGDFTGPQKRILVALGELLSIGKNAPPKEMVAAWASYSVNGSAFTNPLSALKTCAAVHYPQPGHVALTIAGQVDIGAPLPTPTRDEILHRIQDICTGPEWKIFQATLSGEALTRSELAEKSGYSEGGSAFTNPLSALKTKGLVTYPQQGSVQVADWLNEL